MAEVIKNDPLGGAGIKFPALQHKWAVNFTELGGNEKYANILREQAISAKLNIVKGTLELKIEQPLDGQVLFDTIDILSRHYSHGIDVECLDGHANVGCKYRFTGKLVDHECIFDYSLSECVVHRLVFEKV